jgi:predicted small metal-binding protein
VKELRCRDAGFDCDAVVTGQSTEEVLQQVGPHARDVHGVQVTPELEHHLSGLVSDR